MASNPKKTLLWLQSGGCGGCSLSLLGADTPDLLTALRYANIDLLWHPSLSEACGDEVLELFARIRSGEQHLDMLCIEGAVLQGEGGRFHLLANQQPMADWIAALAQHAAHVIAVGTCAAYGGISAAGENLTGATGLAYHDATAGGLLGGAFRSRANLPVINIAGCPTHPNWVLETLSLLAADALNASDLDPLGRPRFYADQLVHHGCAKNEFYEFKASAEQLGQIGCQMEFLGCKGTQAHADCHTRPWNGEGSCLSGGYPCINCTDPEFAKSNRPFFETPKMAGFPIGLPTDMPKAWFVALSTLSKSATPKRVRDNATADRLRTPPSLPPRKPSKGRP